MFVSDRVMLVVMSNLSRCRFSTSKDNRFSDPDLVRVPDRIAGSPDFRSVVSILMSMVSGKDSFDASTQIDDHWWSQC